MSQQQIVLERYSKGAQEVSKELCCPVEYNSDLLAILPQEIIEKDYGCGDPSSYVRPGDTVLDLGSGGGKICYMAAQLVGPEGRVIGVDMNDTMLELARKYREEMAGKLGSDRVEFRKGEIQDLALNLEMVDAWLHDNPVRNSADLAHLEAYKSGLRVDAPLIPDNSVDLVISNCVLNLVDDTHKHQLVREIRRVLKPGGRVAISDIISDETVPLRLKADPELWSGCISGVFQEQEFIDAFLRAGFIAAAYDKWEPEPWRVVEEIEFRSATLTAVKPEGCPCSDIGQAAIYRGPYAEVRDDQGHIFPRGERIAICEESFRLLSSGPYGEDFITIHPAEPKPAADHCLPPGSVRPAKETKGGAHSGGGNGGGCCGG